MSFFKAHRILDIASLSKLSLKDGTQNPSILIKL